jgi:hypothetical protein
MRQQNLAPGDGFVQGARQWPLPKKNYFIYLSLVA